MSLDDAVCWGCESRYVRVEESHNLLNLALGAGAGYLLGGSDSYTFCAMTGFLAYFMDFPFDANRKYHCGRCSHSWDED